MLAEQLCLHTGQLHFFALEQYSNHCCKLGFQNKSINFTHSEFSIFNSQRERERLTIARGRHGRRWKWLGDLQREVWDLRSRWSKWFCQCSCHRPSIYLCESVTATVSVCVLVFRFLVLSSTIFCFIFDFLEQKQMERTLKKKRANYKNLSERDENKGERKIRRIFLPQLFSLFTPWRAPTCSTTGVNNVPVGQGIPHNNFLYLNNGNYNSHLNI